MSLAPGEQRTLTEIENQLRRSDPRLAAMFGLLSAGGVRPVMRPAPGDGPEPHGRTRLIILAAVAVALIIACVATAMNSASHAVLTRAGHGPGGSGVTSTSVYPAGTSGSPPGTSVYPAGRLRSGWLVSSS